MGIWARLTGREPVERRWGGGPLGANGWPVGGPPSGPRSAVHPGEAEGLSAVLACVELIAGAMASLPASLTIDTPDGPAPAPPSAPAWRLLARPNAWQSWPAFMAWKAGQILLQGNGVARVEIDGRGAVAGLTPIPWQWLNPQIIRGAGGGPRLVYDVVAQGTEAALLDLPRRLLDGDVLHVRARSDLGIIGRSVLSRAAGPVREGIAIANLAESNWRNGMRPSGIVTSPAYLSETQRERAYERMEEWKGALAAGRVPLFEGGWKWEQVSLNSVDAEFLDSRQFSVAEIGRLFCVPEPLLQKAPVDPAPFLAQLASQALAPIVQTIEAEFDHAVLPAGMHLQLDMAGLMRGSFSAMVAALATLLQSGAVTANEVRQELSWGRHPDGDQLARGNAPSWPADATGMPHLGPSPGRTDGGLPEPGTHADDGAAA